MPENPKKKNKGTAAEDQKERGYYYDDAHGYEEFDPGADEDIEEESGDVDDTHKSEEREQARPPDLRMLLSRICTL